MRIALFTEWFLPRLGGIELHVRDLALQLKARGHEVEVITPVDGPDEVDGITVRRLGAIRLPGAGIVFTPAAFRRIRRLLEGGAYDVLHVHFGIISPAAYGAARAAQQLDIPTVACFHSVLTHFAVPLGLMRRALGVETWRLQWAAVSSVVAVTMRPLVGDAPVELMRNGVDVSWWSARHPDPGQPSFDHVRSRQRPSGSPLRAVSVMRLHRRKRPAALLKAFRDVARQDGRGRDMTLAIIGDGPEMPALRRAVRAGGLAATVTLRGWVSREEVRMELHRADIFLLPSRLEAFGIAALEARAAGVPVIAMSSGGVRDFLTDGADSLLASDDAHFTRLLRSIADDRSLLTRLAQHCSSPLPGADWDDVVEHVESVYRRVAARASVPTIAAG